MNARTSIAVSAAFLCFSTIAAGYSAYGLGQLECKSYLDRRGEDQEKLALTNTSYIHAYLSGYLTAGNTIHGLVGDSAKNVSIDIHKLVQWLDAWCLKNTTTSIAVALESFWVEAANAKVQLHRPDATQNRR